MLKKLGLLSIVTIIIFSTILSGGSMATPGKSRIGDPNASEYTESKLDSILIEKLNFPEDELFLMPKSIKVRTVEQGGIYVASESKSLYRNNKGELVSGIDGSNLPISILGTIPEKEMQMWGTVVKLESKNGYARYELHGVTKWLKTTFFNWTDKQALAFDGQFQLDVETNGFMDCSHHIDKNFVLDSWSEVDKCGGRPGNIDSTKGAVWNVDVLSGMANATYTVLIMQTKKKQTKETPSQATVGYVHDKSGFGVEANLGVGSISFSGFSNDTASFPILFNVTP
ncbi:hypothetical protein [Mechercharimyces sp. CAU 1602]|uniref:hypothetical protein n=1 Tax=Mechercharimyces sp. CAU 1602 TaxID=2973933 RepID=UPI002162816F|nr:hypothetical protein [Mechercharimyces sp. CAU 1602]MCS1350127.1 hypothetical protein [Mechercharimyces sp. CAU 1602]